jgi:two-component system, NarL family, nitrate/nitrite response regulator NarL
MKILIVDDHVLFREGLAALLDSQPDMHVVGQAGSVKEAISKAREVKPDLVLLDYSLPDADGPEAVPYILGDKPNTIIVFLTVHDSDDRLFAAIRSGARGYLLKDIASTKLLAAIRGLNHQEAAISPVMTERIIEEFSHLGTRQSPDGSKITNLTSRERDVLRELAIQASNLEIASRLNLSETTVKNIIHSLLKKLEVKNRYEAARFARHQGIAKAM